MAPRPDDPAPSGDIIYNGACPVCAAGIAALRAPGGQTHHDGETHYIDSAEHPEILARHGLSARDVQLRLHAMTPEGRLVRGIDAVAVTLCRNPRWAWAGHLVDLPVLRQIGWVAYELAALALFRWNKWRGNF
ncbi:MAG: DCC1-like thiol-disulfide oxidoreductase family protein [Pseudomonadota bacterium]